MSLTRAQWLDMWYCTESIQNNADKLHEYAIKKNSIHLTVKSAIILKETTKIKEQIQSVIGQME